MSSYYDKELSLHNSLSSDKLQEVQNDHATYESDFASKDDIQDDHCFYDQSKYKICEVFSRKSITSYDAMQNRNLKLVPFWQ